MQSFVIVMLKVILANVTSLLTQNAAGTSVLPGGNHSQESQGSGLVGNYGEATYAIPGYHDSRSVPIEELDAIRAQEIMAKAVSGILILLLKWFKLSRELANMLLAQGLGLIRANLQTSCNSSICRNYFSTRIIFLWS